MQSTDFLDVFTKELPVIERAPWTFVSALVVMVAALTIIIYKLLDRHYKDGIERKKDIIADLEFELAAKNSLPLRTEELPAIQKYPPTDIALHLKRSSCRKERSLPGQLHVILPLTVHNSGKASKFLNWELLVRTRSHGENRLTAIQREGDLAETLLNRQLGYDEDITGDLHFTALDLTESLGTEQIRVMAGDLVLSVKGMNGKPYGITISNFVLVVEDRTNTPSADDLLSESLPDQD